MLQEIDAVGNLFQSQAVVNLSFILLELLTGMLVALRLGS
jgi:hypothetical protein